MLLHLMLQVLRPNMPSMSAACLLETVRTSHGARLSFPTTAAAAAG